MQNEIGCVAIDVRVNVYSVNYSKDDCGASLMSRYCILVHFGCTYRGIGSGISVALASSQQLVTVWSFADS